MTKAQGRSGSPSLSNPVLLEKIDKLFACNVGEYIDLPQLVVVGDQSSGKSSVLEGLTKLPFPRDSGLCTRFATQIIFRRAVDSDVRRIVASVIPAPDANDDRASKLRAWKGEDLQDLVAASFSRMMVEIHELMGLSNPKDTSTTVKPTFSKDVFRLEISGPNEDHLSVIDVPGIFKNTTSGLTSKADIQMVREMILGYMKNPRSIMLTVVPANVDIATQEIIEMARDLDPEGERTLGVLTKPDLIDKGAEQKTIQIVQSNGLSMKLGWILVRNLGQQELLDGADRDLEEEAFRHKHPWNSLDPSKFGIKALKIRLQEIVTENVRRAFPLVRAEVTKRLRASRKAIEALGPERVTAEQQASYLLDVISSFQEATMQALGSNYGANNIFDDNQDLRLATVVVNRDIAFAEDLERWGHEYSFDANDPVKPVYSSEDESDEEYEEWTSTRKKEGISELEDILHDPSGISQRLRTDTLEWIKNSYLNSRGFEIGTFNVSLLATIMKKQSQKWEPFALGYISDVIVMVHDFITKVLKLSCHDDRVCRNLLSFLMDNLVEKYKKASEQVEFLLHIERTGMLKTLNHYFNDNLEKCRQDRLRSAIAKKTINTESGAEAIYTKDIVYQHPMSNDEYTAQDIHDILKSYYKVARKRFVDNVCMQAADYYLVRGPATPMKLFSPSMVNKLTEEQLEEIAGEEFTVHRRRLQLKKEIQDLEAGRKILL
ncbi:hypothetical protein MPDQ_002318 [Monascus purpureus]|uniref:GED domain-containing protein n=1 Tax=Monascus purpureus TaxID=5098 RepID=A0A507QPK7_MONPU|nr:hypothetical protein MPDQ_002318 [Monascus purpureus]